MSPFRHISLAAIALAVSATAVPAQFTTVVVPPPTKERPSIPRSMRTDTTKRDTSAVERLKEMSAWVDSAAVAMGIETTRADSLVQTVPADTARAPIQPPPVDTTGGPVVDTLRAPTPAPAPGEFREGGPAPDTATPFPLLALLGASLIGAGALLRRR
jgi:hypothetical protein